MSDFYPILSLKFFYPIPARITKFEPEVQNILLKILIVF